MELENFKLLDILSKRRVIQFLLDGMDLEYVQTFIYNSLYPVEEGFSGQN